MIRQSGKWYVNTAVKVLACTLGLTVLVCVSAYAADSKQAAINLADSVLDKYGSREGIRQNISNPLTESDTSMSTIDGTTTFSGQLTCPSSEKFLDVFMLVGTTGDLSKVSIEQDIDLDGSADYSYQVPFIVSGICGNGVISCDEGTWTNCRHYRWSVDSDGKVSLQEVTITDLGGCYCINNDCGNNLVWTNLPGVLKDLGGGVAGAIQANDPKFAISDVRIDGTLITYYGQDSANCSQVTGSSGSASPEQYFNNPAALSSDTESEVISQSQDQDSYYSMISSSLAAQETAADIMKCSVKRTVSFEELGLKDIIAANGGTGQVRSCGDACIEIVLGKEGNNYWSGNCTVYERYFNVFVKYPELISKAVLVRTRWDDYMQVWIGGVKVWSGPNNNFPPETSGSCELDKSWDWYPNLDVTSYFKTYGNIETRVRVSVTGYGEGYAIVRVYVNELCVLNESIDNGCLALENNSACKLKDEEVDGVTTYQNFNPTGLSPLPSCKTITGSVCTENVCRDWWEKKRTYLCDTGESYDFSDARKRMETITGSVTDGSSVLYYQDYRRDENGDWLYESNTVGLPLKDSYDNCEQACKTRKPKEDTQATTTGHTAQSRTTTQSYDFFYKKCVDNICPAEIDEEIVKDCQCINDFAEAASVMETLNAAGKDVICSSGVKQ